MPVAKSSKLTKDRPKRPWTCDLRATGHCIFFTLLVNEFFSQQTISHCFSGYQTVSSGSSQSAEKLYDSILERWSYKGSSPIPLSAIQNTAWWRYKSAWTIYWFSEPIDPLWSDSAKLASGYPIRILPIATRFRRQKPEQMLLSHLRGYGPGS